MKALSVRQPWAWAILHAGKRIENRDWKGCYYRGPLLIHAAKGCGVLEYGDAADEIDQIVGREDSVPSLKSLDRGGIVGVCTLVNVVRVIHGGHRLANSRRWQGTRCVGCEVDTALLAPVCPKPDPWACGPIGLVVDSVRPLPFVPFKGGLGFFEVPDDLVPDARKVGAL